ncbi:MAG: iron siderophore-binding protein [Pelagibacterium sp. SCN 64-44]|nr:MAG: iron siderophore-binding protein [Pelagibacterium sp. SCN 64-44]
MLLRAALAALLSVALVIPALAQEFPLTIEHKFGTTIIPAKPERVASIDYGGIGNLLALGVQPVIVRDWRDNFPFTAGPWAQPYLKTEPVVLSGDLDLELIARENPDVIIALWSGIDQDVYDKLSLIAPVVAVPEGIADYSLPWDQRALIAGRAVGEQAEAENQIAAIEARLEQVRSSHPEWQGKTAVVGSVHNGEFSAYNKLDVRAQFMAAMGFVTPKALDDATGEAFSIRFSPEITEPIDADVIVWYGMTQGLQAALDFPARPFLKAPALGAEIFLTDEQVAAFARVTLLSIPVTIETLVPMLEAAADGDPATEVVGDLQ